MDREPKDVRLRLAGLLFHTGVRGDDRADGADLQVANPLWREDLQVRGTEQEPQSSHRYALSSMESVTQEKQVTMMTDKKKEWQAAWRATHKDKVREYGREYRARHKEAIKAKALEYRANHREEQNARSKAYYHAHIEERREKGRAYWWEHREELLAKQKKNYHENKEHVQEKLKRYYDSNREKRQAAWKAYYAKHKAEHAAWLEANREHRLAYCKNYYMTHKETILAQQKERKRQKRIAKQTQQQLQRLLEQTIAKYNQLERTTIRNEEHRLQWGWDMQQLRYKIYQLQK